MKLFSKFKDFNIELEEILDKKYFSSTIKNLLLSMIYKIDISYKDFKMVKRAVRNKDNFLEEIVNTIKIYCDNIKTVEPDSDQAKILIDYNLLSLTNERERSILSYPTEISLFYAISDIRPKYYYIKDQFILKKIFQNMLVDGYNSNNLEILSNFNGWSWDVTHKNNINYINNLIYQNLLIIFGEDFLIEWRDANSSKRDFISHIKKYTKKLTGKDDFFSLLCKIIYMNSDNNDKKLIDKILKEKTKQLDKMLDKEVYLENAKKSKLKLTKRVEKIDFIINDDNLLVEEFKKRNRNLDDDKKISSPNVLRKILEKERKKYMTQISDISYILTPSNFINKKQELEDYKNILENKNTIREEIIDFELCFLEIINQKINKAKERDEIVDIIYELRYLKTLYINEDETIGNVKELSDRIDQILKKAVVLACKNGIIKIISMDIAFNFEIIKYALDTKIIEIEEIKLLLEANENELVINVYDKEIFEKQGKKKIENAKKQLAVKTKKMIKLFA